jgi:hypothetical protein
MEWSINLEAKVFVQFSFLEISWHFVNVDNFPGLTKLAILVVDCNVSVFLIKISLDGHDLSFLVDQHVTFPSEELEPSGIGGSHVQVRRPSLALNGDRSAFPLV